MDGHRGRPFLLPIYVAHPPLCCAEQGYPRVSNDTPPHEGGVGGIPSLVPHRTRGVCGVSQAWYLIA